MMKHLVTLFLLTFLLAYATTGSAYPDAPVTSGTVRIKTFEKAENQKTAKGNGVLLRVVHHRYNLLPSRHFHTTPALLNRVDSRLSPATVSDKNELANALPFYHSIKLQLLFPYHNFW